GITPFVTPHELSGIFISKGAVIGEGCTIFQQVTIGSNTLEGSRRYGAPTIGRNVYIGAGAKIIGRVTIGDNARIGAGCVVTEDIPAGATVVLPKPRVILRDDLPDNTFHPYPD
ncbi:MAG: serine acetyltransferase, partial [Clostridia bacterium]|nr:serine acetyltransferase [Clostridia bacterium]